MTCNIDRLHFILFSKLREMLFEIRCNFWKCNGINLFSWEHCSIRHFGIKFSTFYYWHTSFIVKQQKNIKYKHVLPTLFKERRLKIKFFHNIIYKVSWDLILSFEITVRQYRLAFPNVNNYGQCLAMSDVFDKVPQSNH